MRLVLETMLPCGDSEALVGAGLGLILATDCSIFTEFSLSIESVRTNMKTFYVIERRGCLCNILG